jgi:WD40 repeat protein
MAAVISSYNRIAIWEFTNNRAAEIANDSPVLGQIRSFITGSGDIAAASSSDGSVLLFNSVTGNLLRRLDLATWGILNHDLRFNADSSLLAVLGQDESGVDSVLNLIDVQAAVNGESDFHIESSPFIFENQYLSGLAFNSFGDTLITGGSEVRRWPLSIDEASGWLGAPNLRGLTIFAHHPRLGEVATLRPGNYLLVLETSLMNERYLSRFYGRSLPSNTFLEYSHDGNYIIMVGDGAAPKIFNSQTSELLASLDNLGVNSFNAIALSDAYLYLAADVGIYVVNIEAVLLNPDNFLILPYNATQIALSADGKRLFYLGRDGTVRVLGLPED